MINTQLVKLSFNRKYKKLNTIDSLAKEISELIMSRLDYIKLNPKTILDCGSGTGIDTLQLHKRFPKATIIQLDLALNLLKTQLAAKPNWVNKLITSKQPRHLVCADAVNFPLANATIDFCYSNMLLPYLDDIVPFIKEMRRILKLGGEFCLAGLGVDSLKELRKLGLITRNFPDMHDIGDILLTAGFTNPVVDSEPITLDYEHLATLLNDIRLIGCGSAITGNRHYLGNEFKQHLNKLAKLPAKLTLEIFVAHGWKDKITLDLPPGVNSINWN